MKKYFWNNKTISPSAENTNFGMILLKEGEKYKMKVNVIMNMYVGCTES